MCSALKVTRSETNRVNLNLGAYRYAVTKEYFPELYEQLKQKIKSGAWRVAGGKNSCQLLCDVQKVPMLLVMSMYPHQKHL
jgi:hypothetical protein